MIQHPCPKKGIVFTQRAEGQLLYYCVPRAPWNTMLRRCIFLFEVFGSTSNRSSTLYLRGAGGETSLRTAIPFFGQQCQINTQADYNEQVCVHLLSGDRANTYRPLNAPTSFDICTHVAGLNVCAVLCGASNVHYLGKTQNN